MKRLLILLTLPILACGGLAERCFSDNHASRFADSCSCMLRPKHAKRLSPCLIPLPRQPQSLPSSTQVHFPTQQIMNGRLIASGLKRPVDIQPANDGSGRLFIIEKYGVIRIYENGQLLDAPFLDITDRVNDTRQRDGLAWSGIPSRLRTKRILLRQLHRRWRKYAHLTFSSQRKFCRHKQRKSFVGH